MDAYRQGTLIQNQGIFFAKLGYFSYIFKKRTPLPLLPPPPANCLLVYGKKGGVEHKFVHRRHYEKSVETGGTTGR